MISKLLTDRLSKVIDSLIDDSQSAYIKGRLIGGNIVTAHKLLHQVRLTKQKGIFFKLDFEKAFDKVHWDFLLEVLTAIGFGPLFISWITNILQGVEPIFLLIERMVPIFPVKEVLDKVTLYHYFFFIL